MGENGGLGGTWGWGKVGVGGVYELRYGLGYWATQMVGDRTGRWKWGAGDANRTGQEREGRKTGGPAHLIVLLPFLLLLLLLFPGEDGIIATRPSGPPPPCHCACTSYCKGVGGRRAGVGG